MKSKIIFSLLFLIALSLPVFVLAQNCSDTDGGTNYYEKGSASQYEQDESFATDFCESEIQLREYYCKPSGHGISSRVLRMSRGLL